MATAWKQARQKSYHHRQSWNALEKLAIVLYQEKVCSVRSAASKFNIEPKQICDVDADNCITIDEQIGDNYYDENELNYINLWSN